MAATRSSPHERDGARCSESVNQSRGKEGEVATCSVEDGRARSGVAVEKGTPSAVGAAFNRRRDRKGGRAVAACGGEGGVQPVRAIERGSGSRHQRTSGRGGSLSMKQGQGGGLVWGHHMWADLGRRKENGLGPIKQCLP
jgi:hypothetical protein